MIPSLLSQQFRFCLRQDRHRALTQPLPTRHWGKHRSASVAFSSRSSAKREVGLLRPWLVLHVTGSYWMLCHIIGYNWWNWSMVIGHTMSYSWHALSHLLNSSTSHGWGWMSFSENPCSHQTHGPPTATIHNSTLHQAVSDGALKPRPLLSSAALWRLIASSSRCVGTAGPLN